MDRNRVERYLNATVFAEQRVHVTECNPLNSGWESDVYSITVVLESGTSQEVVLRLYQGPEARAKAIRECDGMRRLQRAGVNVPEIYHLELDDSVFGKPFICMEKIHGQTLGEALTKAGPAQRAQRFTDFCKCFVALHKLPWEPFFESQSLPYDPYQPVNDFLTMIQQYTVQFDLTEMEPVIQWLASRRNDVPCERPSVIHWDYHPDNVIIQPDGHLCVIDWTQIAVSDARFDLAWTLMVVGIGDPATYSILLHTYQTCLGVPVENLAYFEAAVLFKRLITLLVPLEYGAECLGMRPYAEEVIRSNVDYVTVVFERLRERTGLGLPDLARKVQRLIKATGESGAR